MALCGFRIWSSVRIAHSNHSFQLCGFQRPTTCMLHNDRRGRYYSKASSLAVPFRFCSRSRRTDIIYMTAPVYITYMVALLDFTLLHTAMKNVSVLAVVGYGKKVHKRASSAARLCLKFTTFQKADDGFYLHVYTLYSLSFRSWKHYWPMIENIF